MQSVAIATPISISSAKFLITQSRINVNSPVDAILQVLGTFWPPPLHLQPSSPSSRFHCQLVSDQKPRVHPGIRNLLLDNLRQSEEFLYVSDRLSPPIRWTANKSPRLSPPSAPAACTSTSQYLAYTIFSAGCHFKLFLHTRII